MDEMILANTYGNVYRFMHKDGSAEQYLLQAIEIGESINNPQTAANVSSCYASIAEFYIRKNDIVKAANYLRLSQRVPAEILDGNSRAVNLRTRYLIDSVSGNYLTAFKEFQGIYSVYKSTCGY